LAFGGSYVGKSGVGVAELEGWEVGVDGIAGGVHDLPDGFPIDGVGHRQAQRLVVLEGRLAAAEVNEDRLDALNDLDLEVRLRHGHRGLLGVQPLGGIDFAGQKRQQTLIVMMPAELKFLISEPCPSNRRAPHKPSSPFPA
jgi:hypothetical protein